MERPHQAESEEPPIRHIEIIITDENNEQVFKASGNVNRKTSHRLLEGLGYIFIPEEPIRYPMSVQPSPVGKISCERTMYCTDYPKKCSECTGNKVMSYFKTKENDLPACPAVIGSDIERANDENYFYYEPGTDASIVVQAAVDYLKAKREEADG